jgi:hypothetical protein
MNDLDLGWIDMHPMLINNVAWVLDHVHVKENFSKFSYSLCCHIVCITY